MLFVVEVDDADGWGEALRSFADYHRRATWRRHTTKPRSSYDMMLQLEKAYAEAIESLKGEVPPLLHRAGEPEPRTGGAPSRVNYWSRF